MLEVTDLWVSVASKEVFRGVNLILHFDGKNLAGESIYERAKLGIALAYQAPPAVRGVKLRDIIRFSAGKNSRRYLQ